MNGTSVEEVKKQVVTMGEELSAFIERQETKFKTFEDFMLEQSSPGIAHPSKHSFNPEESKAFGGYLRTGREAEVKAMSAGSDPDGGYTLPPAMTAALQAYLRERSPLRQLARVISVSTNRFEQPLARGAVGTGWVSETGARSETDAPQFGLVMVDAHEGYAMPKITQTLLDDASFDIGSWLVSEIGEAFADQESAAFINGVGAGQPRGIFTYDTSTDDDGTRAAGVYQHIITGASGAFAASNPADAIINLVYSVKPQYRKNSSFLTSPEVTKLIRKFKDGQGNYLWQPSVQIGQPATFLGYPIYEDENVPAVGAGSLSLAFGEFSRDYTIIDRLVPTVLRDPYTAKPYVLFYARRRVGGGGGRDTRAVKFLKFTN